MVFAKNRSAVLSKETVFQMFEKISLVKSQNTYFFRTDRNLVSKMTLFEKYFVGTTLSKFCYNFRSVLDKNNPS